MSLRAIITPTLVWAQGQHTDLLIPCGVCFSPQFKALRYLAGIGSCSLSWHLSARLCSQSDPVAGATEQAALAPSCFPDCWKHSSWEESHISKQADEKELSSNNREALWCPEYKKDRGFLCEQVSPLWWWLSGYLQINQTVQSLLREVVETSCFCLLSLTDLVKDVLVQNVGLINIFSNRKNKCRRKMFQLFICCLFIQFWSQNPKALMHEVNIKSYVRD